MARNPEAARLTEGHRVAQVRIGAQTVRIMRDLWRLLNFDGTRILNIDEWVEATELLLTRQHRISAATARAYYSAFRLAELGEAGFAARGIPTISLSAARSSMVVTGPVGVRQGLGRGLPLDEAARKASIASAREAMRVALAGGRDQLAMAVQEDDRALGWARTGSSKPCSFCAVLIGRGPVYKTNRTASFQSHASCGCSAEPVYSRDQPWPPGAREIRALYNEATRGERDALNAFRRAYEGQSESA